VFGKNSLFTFTHS